MKGTSVPPSVSCWTSQKVGFLVILMTDEDKLNLESAA